MTNNNHNKHCLEIYEPGDYSGPIPLCANAVGIIDGPEHTKAYLLDLQEPMDIDSVTCSQIVVRPKHNDPIERVVSSVCTVVIYCVKPEQSLDETSEYKYTGVINWGIGKIRPIEQPQ